MPGSSKVEAVDRSLIEREEAISNIRSNLLRAQNRMKQLADKGRSEREFEPGDYVYLKLQPYRQKSLERRTNYKLSKKYYGPYQVIKRVCKVAYKLALPPAARLHHTFHVSLLKKCYGQPPMPTTSPELSATPQSPEFIMARRTVKRGRILATQVLIKWSDSTVEDATWEFLYDLRSPTEISYLWSLGSRIISWRG
ncbi:hypothetical protein RND81_07G134100 [Saponaria officinalis]|uniref:Tf2-1-like SH3-like domain-containing protein n=1 Tax=Saponaria officinalis TaxID=3572 RepID=A0AAW1JRK3_SAPOF